MILLYGWHLLGHSVLHCTCIFIHIVTLSHIKQYVKNSDPESIKLDGTMISETEQYLSLHRLFSSKHFFLHQEYI